MEKKTNILLVDDEQDITSNLAVYLNRSGFETSVAGDGEEALQKAAQNPPEPIVLDVLIPKVDGRQVLRQLREGRVWTPVILLSQVGDTSEREIFLEEDVYYNPTKLFDHHKPVFRMTTDLSHSSPGRPSISQTALCISIIIFVMVGCTTRPPMVATTPESLPIKCEPTISTERIIISNRQMNLTVVDIEVAIEQVQKIIAEFGGYVDQEQTQVHRSTEAIFTVRLPKERLGEAGEKIKSTAKKINAEWAIGQDITEQYADLEVQLCELEEEETALRERIAHNQADNLSAQLVNLEREIQLIRGKIVYRDERLALASLTLHLSIE